MNSSSTHQKTRFSAQLLLACTVFFSVNAFCETPRSAQQISDLAGSVTITNGIRDDVLQYVESQYTQPEQKAAALQMAKALQSSVVVESSSRWAEKQVAFHMERALSCIYNRFEKVAIGSPGAAQAVQGIESLTMNTAPRLAAYEAYNNALDDGSSLGLQGDTCD